MKVFISYNANPSDTAIANKIARIARGAADSIFFAGDKSDPVSTREQTLVTKTIREQLQATDIFIVVGSKEYLDSFWGNFELNVALEIISQKGSVSILPFWIGADEVDPFLSALNTTRMPKFDPDLVEKRLQKEIAAHQSSNFRRPNEPDSKPMAKWAITEQSELFFALLDRHEERLSRQQKKAIDKAYKKIRPSAEKIREPKFMLYQHTDAATLSLIILDANAKVNLQKLRSFSNEYRTLTEKAQLDLSKSGFSTNEVHPMFRPNIGEVKNVLLDANLLFEALMFPDSLILLPSIEKKGSKRISTASSFFRTLKDFWVDRLQFAYCTDRPWQEDQLYERVAELNVYTRFAPTPSNSLHLGNLKAAIIPYILHLKRGKGAFILRFDDTDEARIGSEFYEIIKSDLSWIGIEVEEEKIRIQSEHKKMYRTFVHLLVESELTQNENGTIRVKSPAESQYYFWLDSKRGPVIRKGYLPRNQDSIPLNLNVQDENGNPLYKLAGTIDDIMLSSHVFRGRHQLIQGLTDRQAYIHSVLRNAIDGLSREQRNRYDSLISSESSRHVEVTRRPIPLFAPLIYTHIGEVKDENGNLLSKRANSQTVSSIRSDALFMPEAIVAAFTEPMLQPMEVRNATKNQGFQLLTEVGLDAYYTYLAENLDLSDLLSSNRNEVISNRILRRWEHRILYASPTWSLQKYVARIPIERLPKDRRGEYAQKMSNAIRADVGPDDKMISSWRDVNLLVDLLYSPASITSRLRKSRLKRNFKALLSLPQQEFEEQIGLTPIDQKHELRTRLFDGTQGPRLVHLPSLLGMEHLNELGARI
ncbi:glutamate--tRNA ligase family protein [Salipiger bermudensis]|uniref:glutamate--tRNA ligase family protein n=1 Tax=Salipiger bermudensis TaxID=344736 RepID=UPI0030090EB7